MLLVFIVNLSIIALAVLIHYEFLYHMTTHLPKMKIRHRFRIVVGVFGALIAHTLEIWLFASAYYFLPHIEGWGHFTGEFNGSFMDSVYFSYTTFTTLGFGDIQPHGLIRHLVGIESLTGLLLKIGRASCRERV